MRESADLTVFNSRAVLKGSIQTLKCTSRLLNVEHVCEVDSQLGVCGAKVRQAVVFTLFLSWFFVKSRVRPEGFAAWLRRPPCYQAAPPCSIPHMKHHTGHLCADAGMWMHRCTSGKSVQKPQNEGTVRLWQYILLHFIYFISEYNLTMVEQNHQTTHSLFFSFLSSYFLCLHLCNMIQHYPVMHFLPWPTFAPAVSCGRASRPICRFYLG